MNRRQFAGNLAALASAGFFANWGTAAEIRGYKSKDKPLLTEKNLNRLFEEAAAAGNLEELTKRAHGNVAEFLDSQFSLSPNQQKMVAEFKREDIAALNHVLLASAREKRAPQFAFGAGGKTTVAECAKTRVHLEAKAGRMQLEI